MQRRKKNNDIIIQLKCNILFKAFFNNYKYFLKEFLCIKLSVKQLIFFYSEMYKMNKYCDVWEHLYSG